MPHFYEQGEFACRLKTRRCLGARKSDGKRCSLQVTIGLPYCWRHMRSALGVRVANSRIAGAGKGLFAARDFPRWELIAPYDGEVISRAQLDARYPGDVTGAYALKYSGRPPQFIDAACARSAASIINAPVGGAHGANVAFLTTRQWGTRVPKARRAELEREALAAHKKLAPGDAPPRWRIWVVALRDIANGEELLADYGAEYDFEHGGAHKTKYHAPKRIPKALQARLRESKRRVRHIE
jgi:hypothetical protein